MQWGPPDSVGFCCWLLLLSVCLCMLYVGLYIKLWNDLNTLSSRPSLEQRTTLGVSSCVRWKRKSSCDHCHRHVSTLTMSWIMFHEICESNASSDTAGVPSLEWSFSSWGCDAVWVLSAPLLLGRSNYRKDWKLLSSLQVLGILLSWSREVLTGRLFLLMWCHCINRNGLVSCDGRSVRHYVAHPRRSQAHAHISSVSFQY